MSDVLELGLGGIEIENNIPRILLHFNTLTALQ